MTSNTEIICHFFEAWKGKSLDGILEAMTPDARWLNVGAFEAVGKDAIRISISTSLAKTSSIEIKVLHIAETNAGVVLTERTDMFDQNGTALTVDVMGVFEMQDGKIQTWREYFHSRRPPAS